MYGPRAAQDFRGIRRDQVADRRRGVAPDPGTLCDRGGDQGPARRSAARATAEQQQAVARRAPRLDGGTATTIVGQDATWQSFSICVESLGRSRALSRGWSAQD